MIQRDAVSDLATNMWMRMTYAGVRVVIPPEIIAQLIIQLLTMLASAKCYPTPQAATDYVNSQRFFRVIRIARMTRRLLYGLDPTAPPDSVEAVVQEVQTHCRTCTPPKMEEYFRTIKAASKAPPVQP